MRGLRFLLLGGIFAILAVISVLGLAKLPYARCLLFSADAAEVNAAPSESGFRIGSLKWPVSQYASEPALQPFREEFNRHCAGQQGTRAALCVSRAMAAQFDFGEPKRDFLAPAFDPIPDLAEHLRGEPGHCVTRSSILATQLLSVGIPTRVVQLLPPSGNGHNIVEVWNGVAGWELVDPTEVAVLGINGHATSAASLVRQQGTLQVVGSSAPAKGSELSYARYTFPGTDLVFPEPWLYLRIGSKVAPRPFHGRFGHIGAGQWRTGPIQATLRLAILGLAFSATLCFALALRDRRRRRSLVIQPNQEKVSVLVPSNGGAASAREPDQSAAQQTTPDGPEQLVPGGNI